MLWNVEVRYTDGTSRPAAHPISKTEELGLVVAWCEWNWLEGCEDSRKTVSEIVLTPSPDRLKLKK